MRSSDRSGSVGSSTNEGLQARQQAILEAAVARKVPTDDDTGAREAGTIHYVLSLAWGPVTFTRLAEWAEALDGAARGLLGTGFVDAGSDVQDRVLEGLESAGDPFFAKLVAAVMDGFYGDPRHGGNQSGVSWRMIGFPGPRHPDGWDAPLGWYDEHVDADGLIR